MSRPGEWPWSAPREGASVLVIDDDSLLRNFYAEALGRCGYRVELAEDGGAALRLYRQALAGDRSFDVVLMDMRMPGMDGDACARSILDMDQGARILIVSGNGELELGELEDRLIGVLAKPVGLGQLLQAVKNGARGEGTGESKLARGLEE